MEPSFVDSLLGTSDQVEDPKKKTKQPIDIKSLAMSPRDTMMVGATAALTGVLAGVPGIGFEEGSNIIQNETKKRDTLALASLKQQIANAKAQSGGKRKFKFGTYEDPKTGKVYKTKEDTFTGDIEYTDKLAGYRPFIGKDYRTGELGRSPVQSDLPIRRTVTEGKAPSKFDIKEEGDIKQLRTDLGSDKVLQGYRALESTSSQILELLSSPTALNEAAALNAITRLFEKGTLSDKDREQFKGSQALLAQIDRMTTKLKTGRVTSRDFKEMVKLAKDMNKFSIENRDVIVDNYLKSLEEEKGFDASSVVKKRFETKKPAKIKGVSSTYTVRLKDGTVLNGVSSRDALDAKNEGHKIEAE